MRRRPIRQAQGGRYDPAEIKARLSFLDLAAHEGIAVERCGPNLHRAICPFHQEKSGSFTIYSYDDRALDHAHCFGCGWNGDIIDFWMARRGCDFVASLASLASLASVSPSVFKARRSTAAQVPRMTDAALNEKKKPALPRMRRLNGVEIEGLAALRGLSVGGIAAAADYGRVGFCHWPQFQPKPETGNRKPEREEWIHSKDAAPCWVVTDRARWVAQFRRLDGGRFEIGRRNAEGGSSEQAGREIKAWTKGSPTWPIGAAEIGERGCVLMVEGGADMLAAFHFLWLFQRLEQVVVCAMLGASCGICDGALPFFARKRVRLIMHADAAGVESAGRWTNQLTTAGAAVESFSLEGLTRVEAAREGEEERRVRVGDLNDLALCDEETLADPEVRAAFFDFDF